MKTNANTNENNGDDPDAGLRRKIEERAYHIWLGNGGGHGDHERHWLQAERELLEAAKQERERRADVRIGKKSVNHINHSHNFNSKLRDLKRMKKAKGLVHEAITRGGLR